MKKLTVGFLAALVLLGSAAWSDAWGDMQRPGFAHHPFVHHPAFVHRPFPHHSFPHHHFVRSRVFFGAGVFFPPVFYGPPVVYAPAPVYAQPVYSQPAHWYYCESAQGYYPYVQQCPEGWLEVVPR